MPFGRPSADTLIGGYSDQAGSVTNIYQAIDEVTADDADFIRSASIPATAAYVTKYSPLEDPVSSMGHVFRNRYSKNAAGGSRIDMVFELRQGYVSEASKGTLIASRSFTDVSDAWATDAYTLSAAEADAITDYTDLFLRVTSNQV